MNKILQGDCLIKLKELDDNSVDSIVTDPPYELGFMGKSWDNTGIANNVEMWSECLRVLKPGGHLLAFSGTRTYHRMASAIEDAGFEVRDMIEWIYSTGFPKSLNIAKMLDKMEGVEHPKNTPISDNGSMSGANYTRNKMDVQSDLAKQWEGWGTALKPAHEPICMARKPLAEKTVAENCLKYGTGGINIDESRVGTEERYNAPAGNKAGGNSLNMSAVGMPQDVDGTTVIGRFPANLIHDNSEEVRECFPETKSVKSQTTNERYLSGNDNTKQSGDGKLMYGKISPENTHNDSGNASRFFKSIAYYPKASKSERNRGCEELDEKVKTEEYSGRDTKCSVCGKFFLSSTNPCNCSEEEFGAKSTRIQNPVSKNNHPTVKPIALMEYLIKMVTKPGGIVLDPFAGSGSTLVAAKENGFNYIGIEMTEEYIPIIEARLSSVENTLFS
jgi:DNA modification methylase